MAFPALSGIAPLARGDTTAITDVPDDNQDQEQPSIAPPSAPSSFNPVARTVYGAMDQSLPGVAPFAAQETQENQGLAQRANAAAQLAHSQGVYQQKQQNAQLQDAYVSAGVPFRSDAMHNVIPKVSEDQYAGNMLNGQLKQEEDVASLAAKEPVRDENEEVVPFGKAKSNLELSKSTIQGLMPSLAQQTDAKTGFMGFGQSATPAATQAKQFADDFQKGAIVSQQHLDFLRANGHEAEADAYDAAQSQMDAHHAKGQAAETAADIKLRRENPDAWMEKQQDQNSNASPEELTSRVDSMQQDIQDRSQQLAQRVQALQARQAQFDQQTAEITSQNQRSIAIRAGQPMAATDFRIGPNGQPWTTENYQALQQVQAASYQDKLDTLQERGAIKAHAMRLDQDQAVLDHAQGVLTDQQNRDQARARLALHSDPVTADSAQALDDSEAQYEQDVGQAKQQFQGPDLQSAVAQAQQAHQKRVQGIQAQQQAMGEKLAGAVQQYDKAVGLDKIPTTTDDPQLKAVATKAGVTPEALAAVLAKLPKGPEAEGFMGTIMSELKAGLLPAAGSAIGASLGAAGAGLITAPTGPGAVAGAIAGSIAGGGAGGAAGEWLNKLLIGDQGMQQLRQQLAADEKMHPYAAMLGQGLNFFAELRGGGGGAAAKGLARTAEAATERGTVKAATAIERFGNVAPDIARQVAQNEGQAAAKAVMSSALARLAEIAPMGARIGLGHEAANQVETGKFDAAKLFSETLKGSVTMAPLALFPEAKSIVGAVFGRGIGDAATLTLSNAAYDYAVNGNPLDIPALQQQFGKDVPAFMLQNLVGALMHSRAQRQENLRLNDPAGISNLSLKQLQQEASELRKPDIDPQDALRAQTLVAIKRGQIDAVPDGHLQSVGLERDADGKLVSTKATTGIEAPDYVTLDDKGNPVITDTASQWIKEQFPINGKVVDAGPAPVHGEETPSPEEAAKPAESAVLPPEHEDYNRHVNKPEEIAMDKLQDELRRKAPWSTQDAQDLAVHAVRKYGEGVTHDQALEEAKSQGIDIPEPRANAAAFEKAKKEQQAKGTTTTTPALEPSQWRKEATKELAAMPENRRMAAAGALTQMRPHLDALEKHMREGGKITFKHIEGAGSPFSYNDRTGEINVDLQHVAMERTAEKAAHGAKTGLEENSELGDRLKGALHEELTHKYQLEHFLSAERGKHLDENGKLDTAKERDEAIRKSNEWHEKVWNGLTPEMRQKVLEAYHSEYVAAGKELPEVVSGAADRLKQAGKKVVSAAYMGKEFMRQLIQGKLIGNVTEGLATKGIAQKVLGFLRGYWSWLKQSFDHWTGPADLKAEIEQTRDRVADLIQAGEKGLKTVEPPKQQEKQETTSVSSVPHGTLPTEEALKPTSSEADLNPRSGNEDLTPASPANARGKGETITPRPSGEPSAEIPAELPKPKTPELESLRSVYGIKEGEPDHASFPAILEAAKNREERDKGPFGKFGEMARKDFIGVDGNKLTALAGDPHLRGSLGLPPMPEAPKPEDSKAEQRMKSKNWQAAAQHAMDALGEHLGVDRSSMGGESGFIDGLARLQLPETTQEAALQSLAATEAIHKRVDDLFRDPEVASAVKAAQTEVAAGELTKATRTRLKEALTVKANKLNETSGPPSGDGRDWSELTPNAIKNFISDIASGNLTDANHPEDWLGRKYAEREQNAGRSLPQRAGQKRKGRAVESDKGTGKEQNPYLEQDIGFGSDLFAGGRSIEREMEPQRRSGQSSPTIGKYGGWLDSSGKVHPVDATYGHADAAESLTGIPIQTPDDYGKLYDKGFVRLTNAQDGIYATYGDKKLSNTQKSALERIGIAKEKPVYLDRGSRVESIYKLPSLDINFSGGRATQDALDELKDLKPGTLPTPLKEDPALFGKVGMAAFRKAEGIRKSMERVAEKFKDGEASNMAKRQWQNLQNSYKDEVSQLADIEKAQPMMFAGGRATEETTPEDLVPRIEGIAEDPTDTEHWPEDLRERYENSPLIEAIDNEDYLNAYPHLPPEVQNQAKHKKWLAEAELAADLIPKVEAEREKFTQAADKVATTDDKEAAKRAYWSLFEPGDEAHYRSLPDTEARRWMIERENELAQQRALTPEESDKYDGIDTSDADEWLDEKGRELATKPFQEELKERVEAAKNHLHTLGYEWDAKSKTFDDNRDTREMQFSGGRGTGPAADWADDHIDDPKSWGDSEAAARYKQAKRASDTEPLENALEDGAPSKIERALKLLQSPEIEAAAQPMLKAAREIEPIHRQFGKDEVDEKLSQQDYDASEAKWNAAQEAYEDAKEAFLNRLSAPGFKVNDGRAGDLYHHLEEKEKAATDIAHESVHKAAAKRFGLTWSHDGGFEEPSKSVDELAHEAATSSRHGLKSLTSDLASSGITKPFEFKLEAREVSALKRGIDAGIIGTEAFRNSMEGKSILSKLDSLIKRPLHGAHPMDLDMLPLGHDLKIVDGVIKSIPISVVHNLLGVEFPTNVLGHDESMLKPLAANTIDHDANQPIAGIVTRKPSDVSTGGGSSFGIHIPKDTYDSSNSNSTVDEKAHEAASSPFNKLPEPTPAQAEAENYKVGRVKLSGLNVSIENPAGSIRRGIDQSGKAWETKMRDHYGRIPGAWAPDGDNTDIFIKPGTPENWDGPVFVVNQLNPKTGEFDEFKAVAGAKNLGEAKTLYMRNFQSGWSGMGDVAEFKDMSAFRDWAEGHARRAEAKGDVLHQVGPETDAHADMPFAAGRATSWDQIKDKAEGAAEAFQSLGRDIRNTVAPHTAPAGKDTALSLQEGAAKIAQARNQAHVWAGSVKRLVDRMDPQGQEEVRKALMPGGRHADPRIEASLKPLRDFEAMHTAQSKLRLGALNIDPAKFDAYVAKQKDVPDSNPVEAVFQKLFNRDRYIMVQELAAKAKQMGSGSWEPAGHVADPNEKRMDNVLTPRNEKGAFYLHKDAARIIDNYLGKGLRDKAWFNSYLKMGNALNMAQLGFSLFHAGFVTVDSMSSRASLAIKQLLEGRPIDAVKSAISIPVSPIQSYLLGSKMQKEWLSPGSQGAEMATLMKAALAGGARAQSDPFYDAGMVNSMMKSFRSRTALGLLGGTLKAPFAAAETVMKPLMHALVPKIKLGILGEMMRHEFAKNPNLTGDELRKKADEGWRSVENRLGQVTYDNVHWNKIVKDVAMGSTRAVGWNLGTIRELGGGATDALKVVADLARGRRPQLTHRLAYFIGMNLMVAAAGVAIQKALTGKDAESWVDAFFPRTGGTDASGHEERMALPSYAKDEWAYLTHPGKTMAGKLHPLLSTMIDLAKNKDYANTQIRNPEDPVHEQIVQLLAHAGKQVVPFAYQNLQKSQEPGSKISPVLPFVGVTSAPRETTMSPAERALRELQEASRPQLRTKAQATKAQTFGQTVQAIRSGQPIMTPLTGPSMKAAYKAAGQTPLQSGMSRLDLPAAEKIYSIASPQEKAQLLQTMNRKRANATMHNFPSIAPKAMAQ